MDWLRQLEVEKLLLFTLVLTRVSGLMMTAPVFGTKDIPMTVRGLLSVALAVLVLPIQWNTPLPPLGSMVQYLLVIGSELLVGVCLGLGVMILLSGIQMAGEVMSRIGALSLSDVFDPTFDTNVPLFSRLLALIATAVFVGIGGHRLLMGGLLETFQKIPPGGLVAALLDSQPGADGGLLPAIVETLLLLITASFQLAIRASAPVVATVLLAMLVLGLISRTLPQLNVLVVGFGLNAMLTFGVFALSLGAAVMIFQDQIEPTIATLLETLKLPIPSP